MKTTFVPFHPQVSRPVRGLYLDLMADKEIVMKDIDQLSTQLQGVLVEKNAIHFTKMPLPVSRATDEAIQERIDELKCHPVKFQTTQLDKNHTGHEIVRSVEGLAILLENAGVQLVKRGLIIIKDLCSMHYDENGRITKTEPDIGLVNSNALEVVAGICAQDLGLIIERDGVLVYLYGSSRYEKTPKHVETGYDYFIGEDFLEWHRRIPVWGQNLATLFERMYLAFKSDKFDSLVVDLKGRNLYTDGNLVVRRYERDYALPLPTLEGDTTGMIVFADSLFKNINDEVHPFFGGKHLNIKSPREFSDNFHIITHAAFQHHPLGIRDKNGRPTLPIA